MTFTNIIGYLAAFLGTCLMLPQLIKTIQTKRAEDLSSVFLATYVLNCLTWSIYGFLIDSMPIIVCNIIATCIGFTQVFLKFTYSKPTGI